MIFVWIFGVVYPLMVLLVACFGAVGIGANSSERRQRARDTNPYRSIDSDDSLGRYHYLTFLSALAVAGCALVWPVALPLYFAWKKGKFVSDALDKRDKELAP